MKTESLNDIMIKHIRDIGTKNSILNKNSGSDSRYTYSQIMLAMEEWGNQRFIEGKKEGITEAVDLCEQYLSLLGKEWTFREIKDELISKL